MEDIKILKNGVRILRPCEFKSLIEAIPKIDHQNKLEALLYTGCRYNELRWLFKHPDSLMGSKIKMISLKPEAVHSDRYISLNANGIRAVKYFCHSKTNLPAHPGWDENLIRWCKTAGLDPIGVCCKTTRKTWESWLATMYPNNFHNICLSQGHTERISLDYYLMLPFNDNDKNDMKVYTDGWI
jgi:hypothetical protein